MTYVNGHNLETLTVIFLTVSTVSTREVTFWCLVVNQEVLYVAIAVFITNSLDDQQ